MLHMPEKLTERKYIANVQGRHIKLRHKTLKNGNKKAAHTVAKQWKARSLTGCKKKVRNLHL